MLYRWALYVHICIRIDDDAWDLERSGLFLMMNTYIPLLHALGGQETEFTLLVVFTSCRCALADLFSCGWIEYLEVSFISVALDVSLIVHVYAPLL